MADEITIPYLNQRIDELQKEAVQLKDKLAQNDKWQVTVNETLKKLTSVTGIK
jgi:hypothetical protein